uniref:GYF domain-containing protein n=1 Tax=Kwoniella pini CBS 10737 TaxID=1296096 RepID=A0A1B9HZ93_9TREE|nr:uncharacterized protein I206_05374 [Kwoniella pini CBS 10737]OCF48595.1 hypothetical protein I206_05374 [Kwoniella pini CBS 10737]
MSIHFAPQWVKPIKPSGTSLTTPTSEHPVSTLKSTSSHSNAAPNVPFPALSQNQRSSVGGGLMSPTTQQPLSYSRVTHTPSSPNFPNDPSYFPYQEPNGIGGTGNGQENGTAHPFRYSRDQILNLFDETKFKERPIELVEMAEGGGVLVSKSVNRPVGSRDLSEIEKKLLATSIHPPLPSRRQNTHGNANNANNANANANPAEPPTPNGLPSRRAGGFARGEGGAFGGGLGGKIGTIGGGLISPGGLDSKAPGALGGGFGGVAKRLGRVRGDIVEADGPRSTGPNWRPPRSGSGSFEGVLGFGSAAPSALSTNPLSPNPNLEEPSESGGPGWGTGQKKWRIAAGLTGPGNGDKTLEVPIANEPSSASVIATPSATPVPERDATVLESLIAPAVPHVNSLPQEGSAQPEEKVDLGAIEWFYRDPKGAEQGPFTGTQMHDWYSHSYFEDDLPLRKATESSFRPLAELKVATGSAVQPFLTPIRPRQLPPNLPIPIAALQQQAANGGPATLPDSFRALGVSSPVAADPRVSPQPPIQHTPQQFNQGFLPERAPYSPSVYGGPGFNGQLGSPAAFGPAPGQGAWGMAPGGAPGGPRLNGPFGSIGMPSPIGSSPLPFMPPQHQGQFFSPQIGSPIRGGDLFSPSAGVGAIPPSPWGMPQHPQHSPAYAPHIPQQAPQQAWPVEQHHQQVQPQHQEQQPNPEIEKAVEEALSPVAPQDQVFAPVAGPAQTEEVTLVSQPAPAREETGAVETPQRERSPSPQASPVSAPASAKATASVWGQPASKPASRKASFATPAPSTPSSEAPTPAQASKLPPAPASLPAKPAAHAKSTASAEPTAALKQLDPATPGPTSGTTSGEKSATTAASTKPAPWAIKDEKDIKTISSPSLREIQEVEAKHAEARRAALAEARAASSSPAPTPLSEDFPTSMAWGLPSSKPSAPAPVSAAASPSAPVWGGNDAAPKKTLKQIQEEEEKRKAKAAQAARASQGAPGLASAAGAAGSTKRGYADLAANAASPPVPAGWTTVGASGKPSASAVVTPSAASRVVSTPSAVPSKPATPIKTATSTPSIATVIGTPNKKVNGSTATEDSSAPSVEFIRWVKGALNGFRGDVDDFINNVLLSFPIDIPQSQRSETLEIISDSVYANSSTLDGRRFAQDFYNKRKLDSQKSSSSSSTTIGNSNNKSGSLNKITSLADVVKTQPTKKSDDFGFKIVKGKGKKKN